MLPNFERKNPVTKIGILVKDLRPSTKNYNIIDLGNKIAKEHNDIDFYVFNQDWRIPPHSFSFSVLQQRNAWGFDGLLIATDISSAKKLLNLPNTCQKYFYIWDMMAWQNLPNIQEIDNLYKNPELQLIVRSNLYLDIIHKNFDYPALVIRD